MACTLDCTKRLTVCGLGGRECEQLEGWSGRFSGSANKDGDLFAAS